MLNLYSIVRFLVMSFVALSLWVEVDTFCPVWPCSSPWTGTEAAATTVVTRERTTTTYWSAPTTESGRPMPSTQKSESVRTTTIAITITTVEVSSTQSTSTGSSNVTQETPAGGGGLIRDHPWLLFTIIVVPLLVLSTGGISVTLIYRKRHVYADISLEPANEPAFNECVGLRVDSLDYGSLVHPPTNFELRNYLMEAGALPETLVENHF